MTMQLTEFAKPRLLESDSVELDEPTSAAVSVTSLAGSVDVVVFVLEILPLAGEDYPTLVSVWDNDDDAIYDQI